MNTTPKLIVDCGNFITINSKVPSLLHKSFGGFNDNLMHVFNHLLIMESDHVYVECSLLSRYQKTLSCFQNLSKVGQISKLRRWPKIG
jgi:hypothetical protein